MNLKNRKLRLLIMHRSVGDLSVMVSTWFSCKKQSYAYDQNELLCPTIFVLNPFALRKAKIVYNFGLSESNRVNF